MNMRIEGIVQRFLLRLESWSKADKVACVRLRSNGVIFVDSSHQILNIHG